MRIVDRGGGTPLVIVPGIQGRWEWMKPAVDALATRCHVVTFSLADEPTCGGTFDKTRGFSCYVEQIREALDQAGLRRAAICGVSYGGLIAAAFAASYPDRVSSLVLVSALPPSWKPNLRVRFYLRAPRLLVPLFLIGSLRMYPEIAAARGGVVRAAPAAVRHAWNVLTHMFSPTLMARRVRLLEGLGMAFELSRVHVPTLVITGESPLDRVVPVEATHEYLQVWPHAQVATLPRTGHLGLITRAEEFAGIVVRFVDEARQVGRVRFG
jgi:pimeloyl-ACP methyl ester carboxylesterase